MSRLLLCVLLLLLLQTSGGTDASLIPAFCRPQVGTSQKQCAKRIALCAQANVPMKWSTKGCNPRNQGRGCGCARACTFTCKTACQADTDCYWTASDKTCYSKATRLPGKSTPRMVNGLCEQVEPFTIDLVFANNNNNANAVVIPAEIRNTFVKASQRWSKILSRSLPAAAAIPAGTYCGGAIKLEEPTTYVRNIRIVVVLEHIDGVGGVLGSAGVCVVDDANMPRLGRMRFDLADLQLLLAKGRLYSVVMHETAHVLGLGVAWLARQDTFMEAAGSDGDDSGNIRNGYRYLLPQANLGDKEIGRVGVALVEDEGGAGTAKGHWKESVYQSELMTGWLNTQPNGKSPLSIMSLRAMIDLGYKHVDLSQAEAFTMPTAAAVKMNKGLRAAAEEQEEEGDSLAGDVDHFPIVRLAPS